MKKVILTIVTIATLFSCTTEEMVETQEDTTPVEVSKFTGDFKLYMTVIGAPQAGELISAITHECPNTWTFQSDFILKQNAYSLVGEDCTFKYQSSNSYATPEENVILIGLDQTPYIVTRVGGDYVLTTTNTSTDREVEYFLTRI